MGRKWRDKADRDTGIVSNRAQLADDFIGDLRKTDIPIRFMALDDPERCPVQMITGMMKAKVSAPGPDEVPKEHIVDHELAGSNDGDEDNEFSKTERAREFFHSGDDKIANGDYQGALEDLTEALRLDPDNSLYYSFRGVAYYELGRYQEAIADEDKSIAMVPGPNTLFNRAEAYYKTGRDEEALRDLEYALKLIREISSNHYLIREIPKLIGIIKDKTVSAKEYYQTPIGWDKNIKSKDLEIQCEGLDDAGPEVIQFIYTSMLIDDAWSIKKSRGFTWWGHRLAQRIWAERCQKTEGVDVILIHAETDFLKNVEDNRQTYEGLNILNAQASQFAFVYDPEERRIKLHTSVYTHRQNLEWSKRLLLGAVGLQVSYAHREAEASSHLFEGSEPDISQHPYHGYRQVKDEIVGLIDQFYIPMGEMAPAIDNSTFKQTEEQLQSMAMASSGDDCLTAEFPFSGDEPVSVRLAQGKRGVVTSLLMASSQKRHPLLGKGLMMRMILPVSYERGQGLKIASLLNLKEATEWSRCHLTGAWFIDDQSNLAFLSFIPAAAYKHGVLVNHALSNAIRSNWAAGILSGKGE
jgi:tetratricopeptide (TPR) repeat protein